MSAPVQVVQDERGRTIEVGTSVRDGDSVGVVVEVTEFDVDYDDNVGRAVMYGPEVVVSFAPGETGVDARFRSVERVCARTPDTLVFETPDLEVVT